MTCPDIRSGSQAEDVMRRINLLLYQRFSTCGPRPTAWWSARRAY